MKDISYQQEAIKELHDKTIRLLNLNERRQKIVFKAPTGSGKTYMTAMALESVVESLKTDKRNVYERIAFVWIAPNKLHSQAYDSLSHLFKETRSLNPIMFSAINEGMLNSGDVLCLNWGSIHSDDNILVRESESGFNLWEVLEHTRQEKTAIVAVIDEEHLHWDRTADRASSVLDKLEPIVEIRVSATPKTVSDYTVKIDRKEVVKAQMIKEGIVINPDIKVNPNMDINEYLTIEALKKRDYLASCYDEMGTTINPLLLIQLPNDNATVNQEDKNMRDEIIEYLDKKGITIANGELAIWLADSDNKQNLEGIEKPNSRVKVLIFKEAIAKGWDCPRASVLLIFRNFQSNEFAIQTLGRILRMPEQKYYSNQMLNKGYVYTNISKDRILVAGETEDYWKQNIITACRRENLNTIGLPSVYEFYAASDRNRLGSDFTAFLINYIKEYWLSASQGQLFDIDEEGMMKMGDSIPGLGEDIETNRRKVETGRKIRFDVKGISVTIPKDLNVDGEETTILAVTDSLEYTRSEDKILAIFHDFCRKLLTKYEKACVPILAGAITDAMEILFGVNEWDARRVILSAKPNDNIAKFTDVLTRALNEYYGIVTNRRAQAKERSFKDCIWTVPESRLYNADHNTVVENIHNHALMPFVQSKNASAPERDFESFLEKNAKYIDWWYKNGDEGRQHYAIEYINTEGKKALFYVDFIIRMKNGQIFLFDTKSAGANGDLDTQVVSKHNALIDYMIKHPKHNLKGGILKYHGGAWKYSPKTISNTTDLSGWFSFFPDQIV